MTTPRTQRISGEQRREQIVAAAIELFAERGFSGTTTRELAERVGISEAGLYLHFDTKEALYEAIMLRKAEEKTAAFRRVRELADAEAPPAEVFGEAARVMLETHTRDTAFLRLLLHSGLERHPLFRMFFEAQVRAVGDALRGYVERQQARGAFRPCEPRLAVRAFMGMLVHHLLVQEVFKLHELGVFEPARVVPVVVSIFLQGLEHRSSPSPGPGSDACA